MTPTPEGGYPAPETGADDPRLLAAVREYLAELEAGRRPDRRAFAARFPDLAEAAAPYLDTLDMVHAAAPLLNSSPAGRPAHAPEAWYPADPLGDFRIVREIGRGGMGVVYEAVQLSLGRRVALKVLPFAAALDARQLQRFKNEAQAAAQLHHPGIVPVYAVGCERGVHYYAMQLIEGQTVAGLVRQLRQLTGLEEPGLPAGQPRPHAETPNALASLSTDCSRGSRGFFHTVARLGVQAAEALEHAHQEGVVHRDVKPANLIVDGRGQLWITDFGLAQFHADTGLTRSGDMLGTLRYMSPEQALGKRAVLDHRTDVYSLGMTLYELLTLEPAFAAEDRQELLTRIACDDPRPPRAVRRAIPAELETVVLKAIAKEPGDRYASAQELADDLRRFLDDRPILARRPSLVEKGVRWARRRPAVVAGAVLLLALIAAGSLLSAGMIRAAYERERQQAREAREQAARAEERLQLARRPVDLIIQVCEEELADKPHLTGLRKRLLEAVLVYYQEFIEQRRDDPDAQAELAATREGVKKILADLAVLQGAGQLFLLNDPAVLNDLGLSGDQREQLADLSRRLTAQRGEAFRDFHRLSQEERRKRFLDLARSNEAGVNAILDRGQLRRLGQIAVQIQGPMAFHDPDVVARLKLTAGQRERIRAIEGDLLAGMADWPRPGPPGPGAPRKGHEQAARAALEKMQALLTKEQAARWQELTGEPFRGRMPPFFPGPPGAFGPPR
jgi:serine/threonine protein kinase